MQIWKDDLDVFTNVPSSSGLSLSKRRKTKPSYRNTVILSGKQWGRKSNSGGNPINHSGLMEKDGADLQNTWTVHLQCAAFRPSGGFIPVPLRKNPDLRSLNFIMYMGAFVHVHILLSSMETKKRTGMIPVSLLPKTQFGSCSLFFLKC